MPNRWLHEFLDIVVQGRSGWTIHKWKDEPSKWLKWEHRKERHDEHIEWQRAVIGEPVFNNPCDLLFNLVSFPKVSMTFEDATHISHEIFDRVWSSLPKEERYKWIETYKYVIENPDEFPNLLYPEDLKLPDFVKLQNHVKSESVEKLI